MAVQKKCYAPSAVELRGSDAAIRFGRKLAEKPIEADFAARKAAIPGRHVYFDDLSDNNYILFLVERNHPMPPEAVEKMKSLRKNKPFRRPDIVLHHPTAGREYYEIKPASVDGLAAGREKLPIIDRFLGDSGLSYPRGDTYPAAGDRPSTAELRGGPRFVAGLARILTRGRLKSAKMVLTWDRIEAGLIGYWICAEIETDDDLENLEIAWLAGYLVQMLIASQHPNEMPGFAFPQDVWTVDLPIEISWMREHFIAAARARLVDAVPGDEWQILCDQVLWDRLITTVQQWPLVLRQLLGIADLQAEWRLALRRDRIERRQKLDDLMVLGAIALVAGACVYAMAPAAAGAALAGTVTMATEAGPLLLPSALQAGGLSAGVAANDVAVGGRVIQGAFRTAATNPVIKETLKKAACFAVVGFIGESEAKAAVRDNKLPFNAVKTETLTAVRRHAGNPFMRIEMGGDTKVGGKRQVGLKIDMDAPDPRILAVLKYT